jgi:alpha-galactosidase
MTKLTMIGAGSTAFTKRIITDIFLMPEVGDMEIALMDIDPDRLAVCEVVVKAVARQIGVSPRVTATTDRRVALRGADFVQTTIQVAGYKPGTLTDFDVPKSFGLRQTIADTLGIGGIMRALRTVPVLVDIGRDIAELCPDAIWLQYVNPMAMNMMAIDRMVPGLKAVGLCHSVQGTAEMLARDLGEDINNINFKCAGINHMAFYSTFEKILADGSRQDLYPRIKALGKKIVAGEERSNRTLRQEEHGRFMSEKVRYEMLARLGFFVTESSEHFAEYVPWFIKRDRPDLIEQYEIPLDEYIDRCEMATKRWALYQKAVDDESKLETYASNEYASEIIRAVMSGTPTVINGNVPNNGLISNLPSNACVEVPCLIDKNGINPTAVGKIPPQLAALMRTNINVQDLTVEALATGKREHVYHAAMMDPHTAAELSIDEIWKLVDAMIDAHGDLIPALS